MSNVQIKKECDRVGRSFSLLFNRSTMYQLDHPYTSQSIKDFFHTIQKALDFQSPLVLIMNRDQFFIEDEPLDPRLNVTRMVAHFKKAGIQSVSFHEGILSNDISEFVRVFIDLAAFPNVDGMRNELGRVGVESIKLNHVVYKKVTEDDAVVSKDVLSQSEGAGKGGLAEEKKKSVLSVVAGGLVMEELEQALSLRYVIDNPGAASRTLIDSDLASAQQGTGGGEGDAGSGAVIVRQLNRLRSEVEKVTPEMEGANLAELAEAVFDMKRKLLSGIEAQKSAGVVYIDEAGIHQEAHELTDRVFIQLVRDEYRKGAITVKRLAQIIRRLIPDPQELQRLMPALKEALVGEGMPLTDYMELIGALGKELQSQGLAQVLAQGAEEIGVEGEDLIQEVLSNPQIAAELIYLSAEIRKGAGDEKLLSDLLVDYIERIGGQLSLEAAANAPEARRKNWTGCCDGSSPRSSINSRPRGCRAMCSRRSRSVWVPAWRPCSNGFRSTWINGAGGFRPVPVISSNSVFWGPLKKARPRGRTSRTYWNRCGPDCASAASTRTLSRRSTPRSSRANLPGRSSRRKKNCPAGF